MADSSLVLFSTEPAEVSIGIGFLIKHFLVQDHTKQATQCGKMCLCRPTRYVTLLAYFELDTKSYENSPTLGFEV